MRSTLLPRDRRGLPTSDTQIIAEMPRILWAASARDALRRLP